MSDIFVLLGGAALAGFAAGATIVCAWKLWHRLRTRHRRFRYLG